GGDTLDPDAAVVAGPDLQAAAEGRGGTGRQEGDPGALGRADAGQEGRGRFHRREDCQPDAAAVRTRSRNATEGVPYKPPCRERPPWRSVLCRERPPWRSGLVGNALRGVPRGPLTVPQTSSCIFSEESRP